LSDGVQLWDINGVQNKKLSHPKADACKCHRHAAELSESFVNDF